MDWNISVTFQGRKPVNIGNRKPFLAFLESDEDEFSFAPPLFRYTERRRVLRIGRITLPLGPWHAVYAPGGTP